MRNAILLAVLLSAGCANFEAPPGHVMLTDHSKGRVYFKPAKFIYLPDERLPSRGSFDFSLTMCSIYG